LRTEDSTINGWVRCIAAVYEFDLREVIIFTECWHTLILSAGPLQFSIRTGP